VASVFEDSSLTVYLLVISISLPLKLWQQAWSLEPLARACNEIRQIWGGVFRGAG